jgi:2-(1,2-epoxy-1,2-dihydrophenyl)acetyl-CoA isomerase
MEVLMTANEYSAQQALDWGLVSYLYPPQDLPAAAEKMARDISAAAPLAVGAFKKIIKRGDGVDLMTQLDMEVNLQSMLLRTVDFQEGIQALIEKRAARWKRK